MKFFSVILFAFLSIASGAHAQNFDGSRGYIFDQSYVTRIEESDAASLVQIKSAADEFWKLYKRKESAIPPKGVKKLADTLVFDVAGMPSLSLKSYIYKGKDDSGDSQRFSYVAELEKFHLVVVEFDHDQPCFILVNKATLKVYFVDYSN